MKRTGILAAAAAVLLLQVPVFAQHQHGHDHGKAQGHEKKEEASCPHMTALQASVNDAIALLEKGKGNPANVDKALAELREAKGHLTQCNEMCAMHMKQGHANHAMVKNNAAATKVTDPVCGMKIDPATAAAKSVYAGKTYYFCSKEEKAKFDKNPEAYLKKG